MRERLINDVRGLLTPLDPEAPHASVLADKDDTLQEIMAKPRPDVGTRARPFHTAWRYRASAIAVTVATIALATVTTVVLVRPAAPAYAAATPQPLTLPAISPSQPASSVLAGLLRQADVTQDPQVGPNTHITTVGWALTTRINGRQVRSAVIPEERDLWINADGSGRETTRYLPPVFDSAAQRQRWLDEGSPGADTSRHITHYSHFDSMWKQPAPTEPTAMKRWLAIGHPISNGPAETLVAINDLAGERVLDPRQQAAVLHVLADLPGLRYDGITTDRGNRRGLAFSVDSSYAGLPTRYTVVLDPGTGALLDYEETLTTRAGALDVRVPAVISYTAYLVSENTTVQG